MSETVILDRKADEMGVDAVQLLLLHLVGQFVHGIGDDEVLMVLRDHPIDQFPVAEQQLLDHLEAFLVAEAGHVVAA